MKLYKALSLCFLLLLGSVGRVFAESIIKDGPSNLTVQPGQWGNFTCRVACTHRVNWYVEGHNQGVISTPCSSDLSGQTICFENTQNCPDSTSTAGFISTLRVLAMDESAGMDIAVQCSAAQAVVSDPDDPCPPPYLAFSRFSSLRVMPLPEPTTPPTEPVPTPSPVVCPEAAVTTITETVTPTAVQPSVVTRTVTVTVTVTPEVPAFTNPAASHARSHLGKVVYELLTWAITITAGIVFV